MAGTPSLRKLKADLAEHRQHCEAKKRRCPYEEKVEKQIKKEEMRDHEDVLSPETEYMNAVRGENASGRYNFGRLGDFIQRAARTFNAHADRGDFKPNMSKIAELPTVTAELVSALLDPYVSASDKAYASDLIEVATHITQAIGKGGQYKKTGFVKAYSPGTGYSAAVGATSGSPQPSATPPVASPSPSSPNAPAAGNAGTGNAGASSFGGILSSLFGGANGGGSTTAPKAPAPTAAPSNASHKTSGLTPFCDGDGSSPYEGYLSWVNPMCKAATDPNAWKNEADALTDQQALQMLEAIKFGKNTALVKGGYHDTFDKSDPDEPELWSGWSPSKSLSHDTLRCAAVCFKDLSKRFPSIKWKDNLELRCGTKPMTGGQSTHTKDDRRHTVLFNCDYSHIWSGVGLGHGASNYGHADNRFPYDVLRHELGHALISGTLPNGKRMISKWHDAMAAAYGNPSTALFDFARKYISHYAVADKGRGPSMAECLSECFSVATSPDYKPGYLPLPVEKFIFTEMLGINVGL